MPDAQWKAFEQHPHRHDRRPQPREPVRLEDRPEDPDRLEHLPAAGRQQGLDLRPGRHLRRQGRELAEQHQQRLDQLRLLRRGQPVRRGRAGNYVIRARRRRTGATGRSADRRDVRELAGRDQDPDREGLQPRLHQADRRHRPDRALDPVRGVLHPAARGRQHHGAERARAHPGTGGAEDARLHRRQRARVRAGRGRGALRDRRPRSGWPSRRCSASR